MKLLSLSLIALLTFSACSSDDDAPELINQEEVITTLNVYLTPEGGTEMLAFSYNDLDADGLNPEKTTMPLSANTTYTGRVEFLNKLEDPAEDITVEVREEGNEHQVFYLPSTSLDLNTTYLDTDVDGNPIGVEFRLQTTTVSNGILTFILIHDGNKFAAGASEGILSDSVGGETDIEATFDVTIQ
ncbi:type 1 periplasmic binding fold superfamily protein [Psychroflexus aurantiacus]|nr:type 1 periplasmic binding fold superfamily protein [Psychroflexus aurantiacus]